MRYTFVSAHVVRGLGHPRGADDIILFDDRIRGIRVLLVANAIPHLRLLSRHSALMSMLLRGLIGAPQDLEFPERLLKEVSEVEQQRRASIGDFPVVVIEVNGDVDGQLPAHTQAIQDFLLCFDAFDKKALQAGLRSDVSAVLTALRTGTNAQLEFRPVSEGTYLLTDDDKVVHSSSAEGFSPTVYGSPRLTQEQRARVAADIPLALSAGSLDRVMRLHSHSLNTATDNYRAYVSAWSALEILIGKLFPIYQTLLATELRTVNTSPGLHAYLDRVANVMKDKYNVADKFAVLSVYLDVDRVEDEVRIFRDLKRVRDQLSHGEEIVESSLPTRGVQLLFDKYIRNHLRRQHEATKLPKK